MGRVFGCCVKATRFSSWIALARRSPKAFEPFSCTIPWREAYSRTAIVASQIQVLSVISPQYNGGGTMSKGTEAHLVFCVNAENLRRCLFQGTEKQLTPQWQNAVFQTKLPGLKHGIKRSLGRFQIQK